MTPSEFDLKQAAIAYLHGMLRGEHKLSRIKGELALACLTEMREAKEDRQSPEWVQQLYIETPLENERERHNKGRF